MPIRNEIEAILQSLPGQPINFYYGTYNEINDYLDKNDIAIPAICLYQQQAIGLEIAVNGSVGDDYNIHMDFRMWSKFEKNTAQDEDVVNQMLLLCKTFLLYMSKYVKSGEDTRFFVIDRRSKFTARPVYKQADAGFCGVSLDMKAGTRLDPWIIEC